MRLEFLGARRHDIIGWRSIVSPKNNINQLIKLETTVEGSFLPMVCEYCLGALVGQGQRRRKTNRQRTRLFGQRMKRMFELPVGTSLVITVSKLREREMFAYEDGSRRSSRWGREQ